MPRLKVADLDIYYRQMGRGFPVVMIMGFTANVDWWPDRFLARLAENYRLVIFDNRCAGRTGGGTRRFSIPQAARDTLALMDGLGIERAHVIGISMGGLIAQEMALRGPQRVVGLVLGCTTCGPLHGRIADKHTWKFLWRLVAHPKSLSRPLVVNLLFTRAYLRRNRRIGREFARRAGIAPIGARNFWRQFWAIARFNSYRRLRSLSHATLVIAGTRDPLIPHRNSQILARRIPHARLLELEDTSLAFICDRGEDTLAAVLPFLAAAGGASP